MSMNGRRRIVITGMGAVTPLGNDVKTTWENLLAGKSGAGPITQFDSTGYPVTFAVNGKQHVAVSTGGSGLALGLVSLTPELKPGLRNQLYVFALP